MQMNNINQFDEEQELESQQQQFNFQKQADFSKLTYSQVDKDESSYSQQQSRHKKDYSHSFEQNQFAYLNEIRSSNNIELSPHSNDPGNQSASYVQQPATTYLNHSQVHSPPKLMPRHFDLNEQQQPKRISDNFMPGGQQQVQPTHSKRGSNVISSFLGSNSYLSYSQNPLGQVLSNPQLLTEINQQSILNSSQLQQPYQQQQQLQQQQQIMPPNRLLSIDHSSNNNDDEMQARQEYRIKNKVMESELTNLRDKINLLEMRLSNHTFEYNQKKENSQLYSQQISNEKQKQQQVVNMNIYDCEQESQSHQQSQSQFKFEPTYYDQSPNIDMYNMKSYKQNNNQNIDKPLQIDQLQASQSSSTHEYTHHDQTSSQNNEFALKKVDDKKMSLSKRKKSSSLRRKDLTLDYQNQDNATTGDVIQPKERFRIQAMISSKSRDTRQKSLTNTGTITSTTNEERFGRRSQFNATSSRKRSKSTKKKSLKKVQTPKVNNENTQRAVNVRQQSPKRTQSKKKVKISGNVLFENTTKLNTLTQSQYHHNSNENNQNNEKTNEYQKVKRLQKIIKQKDSQINEMSVEISNLKELLSENDKITKKQKKLIKNQDSEIQELIKINEKLRKKNELIVNALELDKQTDSLQSQSSQHNKKKQNKNNK